MAEEIPSLANNTQATGGHMELVGAFDGFNESIRVPGSRMRYQCSGGFGMEDGTNPIQELQCLGSRMIDRTQVTLCERKQTIFKTDQVLLLLQQISATLVSWTRAAQREQVSAGQGRSSFRLKTIHFKLKCSHDAYQTGVKYICPPGQAFDGLYKREEWGNCSGSGVNTHWKYNTSNPLPNCIGECVYF